MKNIFAKTSPVEFQSSHSDLRNWRFLGMEMEGLGTRLDAARRSLANARTDWARWYWQETLGRLMIQWRHLVPLHDGDARMSIIPRWTVNYEYYENSNEIASYGIDDKLFDKIFREPDLNRAWERARNARIAKCNCQ